MEIDELLIELSPQIMVVHFISVEVEIDEQIECERVVVYQILQLVVMTMELIFHDRTNGMGSMHSNIPTTMAMLMLMEQLQEMKMETSQSSTMKMTRI